MVDNVGEFVGTAMSRSGVRAVKKHHSDVARGVVVEPEPVGYRKNWPHVVARSASSPAAPDDRTKRLDQLSPLIHDLLAWELVNRTDTGEFVLCGDVQSRLAELSARQVHPSPAVYVGRPCAHCGATGVTRLVDGVRACPSCAATPPVEVPPPTALESVATHKRRERGESHSWWAHKVG